MTENIFLLQSAVYILSLFACLKIIRIQKFSQRIRKIFYKLNDGQIKFFVVLSVIFSSAFIICDGHNWGGDFSQYLAQSRAILTGTTDAWLEKQSFIISHSTPGFSPLIYPWTTAIILLPTYKIFGLNLIAFKLTEVFLLAAAWIIFFAFLRLKENFLTSTTITAILFFNAHYIFLPDNVLSECPFLLFVFLSIFFYCKRKENFQIYSLLLGMGIFFASNTRSFGIALLIALFLDDLFILRKSFSVKKILPRTLPYIVYGVFNLIFSRILPQIPIQNNSGYLVTFSLNPSDIFTQIIYYTKLFGSFFLPNLINIWDAQPDGILILLAGIFFIGLSIFGAVKNFPENRFLFFYIAITLATVTAFNTQAGIRYIFGIIPFVLYFAFLGIKNISAQIKFSVGISIMTATIFFSLCSIAIFNVSDSTSNQAYTKEAVETYNFINENISDDKVIFFFKPRVLYFNTNNYSYFFWEDEENSLKSADYVLLTEGDYFPKLKEILKDKPQKYFQIYGNEKFNLYRIEK